MSLIEGVQTRLSTSSCVRVSHARITSISRLASPVVTMATSQLLRAELQPLSSDHFHASSARQAAHVFVTQAQTCQRCTQSRGDHTLKLDHVLLGPELFPSSSGVSSRR